MYINTHTHKTAHLGLTEDQEKSHYHVTKIYYKERFGIAMLRNPTFRRLKAIGPQVCGQCGICYGTSSENKKTKNNPILGQVNR